MEKVIFDSFEPDAACFADPPTNPLQQDPCIIKVTWHNPAAPEETQTGISFQREKDHYIYNTTVGTAPTAEDEKWKMFPSKLAVMKGLGFDEKDNTLQSALQFSVYLNKWHSNTYTSFQDTKSYKGPDLLPLTRRLTSFFSAGNIEKPDPVQKKAMASLLQEILPLTGAAKDWFSVSIKFSLTGQSPYMASKKLSKIPDQIRPRIQWFMDQIELHEEMQTLYSSVDDPALAKQLDAWVVSAVVHLNTGEGDGKKLQKDLDSLARELRQTYGNKAVFKDFYASLLKKLEPAAKDSFYADNVEARSRLNSLLGFLRQAVADHRAELISLEAPLAFRKSLEYRVTEAAEKGYLASRVKLELEEAHLSPQWLKNNIEELQKAIVPHLTLIEEKGKLPRVRVDADKIAAREQELVKTHFIQEREYRIGMLAVLRYLLGNELNSSTVEGWWKDGYKSLEADLTEDQSHRLLGFRDHLNQKISKSVTQTSILLPIGEGAVLLAGTGVEIYGLVKDKGHKNIFTTVGAIGIGAGGGALGCHALLKTRNQYISDLGCGVLGGIVGGVGASLLLKPSPGGGMGPPGGSPIDGRDPIGGFGP